MSKTELIKAKNALTKILAGLVIICLAGFAFWCLDRWIKIEVEQMAEEAARNTFTDEYEEWKNNRGNYLPENAEEISDGIDPSLAAFYASMKDQNEDYIGWLEIPGTDLSTPVVQYIGTNADYYLTHNFNNEYSNWGCPYARYPSTLETDNLFIYGHHIRNGQLFSVLDGYKDQSWKDSHEVILLTTETEVRVYRVFCAFTMSMNNPPFQWNQFVTYSPTMFDDYIANCNNYNMLTSDLTPSFGTKLLTLVTCEYSHTNGRLVVIAMQTASYQTVEDVSKAYSSATVVSEDT